MSDVLAGYQVFVEVLKRVLFWLAVGVAVVALVDWAVRSRKLNPFGAVARFVRRFVDPLMAPIERRIVRAGGLPTSAPWWTLVFVVVGGLLLITVLQFLYGVLVNLAFGLTSPGAFGLLLVSWAFAVFRIALWVRVISTWFRISPYSKWIRWSYVLTEWMLAPLRRVVPPFGAVDVTPIVALLILWLLQSALGV